MIETKSLFRSTDPSSSATAAEQLTRSGKADQLRSQVLASVRVNPGLTSRELSVSNEDVSHENFHKRLPELERQGKVHRSEPRACRVTGRKATTWHLGPDGDFEQMELI